MTPEIGDTPEVLPHHPQQPGHRPQGQQQLVVGQAGGGEESANEKLKGPIFYYCQDLIKVLHSMFFNLENVIYLEVYTNWHFVLYSLEYYNGGMHLQFVMATLRHLSAQPHISLVTSHSS